MSAYYSMLCQQTLKNRSIKFDHLENHLRAKHLNHVNSNLKYFKTFLKNLRTGQKLLRYLLLKQQPYHIFQASYEFFLLIAKNGKNYTIGEQLVKPAISVFVKKVLQKGDEDVQAMPFSNSLVSRRINEMGQDVK